MVSGNGTACRYNACYLQGSIESRNNIFTMRYNLSSYLNSESVFIDVDGGVS